MPRLLIVGLVLSAAACGPKSSGGEATGDTTGTTAAGSEDTTPTSSATTSAASTSTGAELPPDDELCQAYCTNADSTGCGFPDCVNNCLAGIMYADDMGCGPQWRASVQCEGTQPLDYQCSEASGCAAEYIPLDACYFGDCVHLGAGRVTETGGDTCSWGALLCYGHNFEMECTATADAQCSCKVDKVELGTCAAGEDIEPDVCDNDFGTFKGCCTDIFLAALQP